MILLTDIASVWGPIKIDFEKSIGLSPDALHIHIGLALLMLFALVTRRPLHDWRPWLMVLLVEVVNEIIDMNQSAGSIENNWIASRHDLINTMFLPTLLLIYYSVRRQERSAMMRHAAQTPAE